MNSKTPPPSFHNYSFEFIDNLSKRFSAIILFCFLIFSSKTYSQSVNSVDKKAVDSGCGQGYWKNHTDLWNEMNDAVPFSISRTIEALGLPYSGNGTTNALYKDVFGITTAQMITAKLDPDLTLEQAINSGGGEFIKLTRQSIAALLNAAATDFTYKPARVLTLTHDAIISRASEPLATQFDNANEGHCVFGIPPTCNLRGPTIACRETNSLSYTANVDVANGAVTYQWGLLNNTAGASLSGTISGITSTSPISINVVPISTDFIVGGHFNLQLIVARSIYNETCYLNSEIAPDPVVSCSANPSIIDGCALLSIEDRIGTTCELDPFVGSPSSQLDVSFIGSIDTDPTHYTYLWTEDGQGSLTSLTIKNPVYTAALLDAAQTINFTITVTSK